MLDKTLDALQAWFTEQGIYLHPSLCIHSDESTGLSIRLEHGKVIEYDDLLASIPETAILSPRTASLQCDFPSVLNATLRLTICLTYEMCLPTSKWRPYFASLPEYVGLPVSWPVEAWQRLEGTELARHLDANSPSRLDLHQIFLNHALPLLEGSRQLSGCTFDAFVRSYELVSSRAFWVNEHHRLAMVPLADMYIHFMHL